MKYIFANSSNSFSDHIFYRTRVSLTFPLRKYAKEPKVRMERRKKRELEINKNSFNEFRTTYWRKPIPFHFLFSISILFVCQFRF